eukprot:5975849-Pyramimonas_sp.AAC.1
MNYLALVGSCSNCSKVANNDRLITTQRCARISWIGAGAQSGARGAARRPQRRSQKFARISE